ncbi:MAG: hypothetical protein IJX39_07335 [Clostridia bacterium]|nr:hypothetical protein [Clostridia bacterium]
MRTKEVDKSTTLAHLLYTHHVDLSTSFGELTASECLHADEIGIGKNQKAAFRGAPHLPFRGAMAANSLSCAKGHFRKKMTEGL